jgi:hypothetical protein
MKRALIIALLGLGLSAAEPAPAHCAICVYSGNCLDASICGKGCVCLKPPMESWGKCFAID